MVQKAPFSFVTKLHLNLLVDIFTLNLRIILYAVDPNKVVSIYSSKKAAFRSLKAECKILVILTQGEKLELHIEGYLSNDKSL